ncbi:MFS transporter [Pseudomonas lactis]|uniref:MFS transporter n=1 Tax=Pseudomonas lactis TaxID=1615674 RepID=UPI001C49C964
MPSADYRSPDTKQPLTGTSVSAVLLPLMLVLFISTLDQTIVATALAQIGEELGDAANAPWIATAYLLTSAISTLIFGKLGDMHGRKKVFQASVAIFVLGSALCSFAPTMLWLIGFRALQGIGGGGLNSLVMAIVGDMVSPRERARYQATLGIVPAIAIILGPVLGGLIVDHWSWPWIFLINVPIGVLAFVIIATRLHLPTHKSAHRLDIAGFFRFFLPHRFCSLWFRVAVLLLGGHGRYSVWRVSVCCPSLRTYRSSDMHLSRLRR